ncbi:hypothetical protein RJ640_021267 [Escallonia rubra]|uniref:Protein LURP-one-related 5 n=1 Tax=Escallonia rubra TaxID=112253 RepID=A0AA88R8D1_9ASTE|nr:hypothetical protein RJ640_021267 [Escallonia rubra]
MTGGVVVEDGFVHEEETHLTVFKTSLFFPGDGFTVYNCKGELVFRVESYGPDSRDKGEVELMDAFGRCLLTARRKDWRYLPLVIVLWLQIKCFVTTPGKLDNNALGPILQRPSLHQRWEGFLGEKTEGQKPIFSVRRSSIIGRSSVTVEMCGNPGEEYQIEGSFAQRCCTIFNAGKEAVAEIRRKVDASTNVVLGKDVFTLSLKPGFDGAFAMGLVLVLDQINGDDYANGDGGLELNPTSEDSHLSP